MTKDRIKEIISEVYKRRYPNADNQKEIKNDGQISIMHFCVDLMDKIDQEDNS